MSNKELASYFQVHPTTITSTLKRYAAHLLKPADLQILERNRKQTMQAVLHGTVPYISDPAKLEKASWLQAVTGFGILYDKLRLEEGKSTQNLQVLDIFETVRQYRQNATNAKNLMKSSTETESMSETMSDNRHYVNFKGNDMAQDMAKDMANDMGRKQYQEPYIEPGVGGGGPGRKDEMASYPPLGTKNKKAP
jgi:hypothetical protein